jgi:PAS domain S-box-containing protein
MNSDNLRVLNLEADDDDHDLIRKRAVETGLNLQFERARNRAEFEAALKRGRIDLILADHCIPGYDGAIAMEAAARLAPDAPYIIVSDSIGEDRAVACLKRGALDFVHKDRLELLPTAIAQALQKPLDSTQRLAAEDRFLEMADNIRDVFWVCASDSGRLLYVSPAYDSIWGRSPEGIFSAQLGWPEFVLTEDLPVLAGAKAQLKAGSPYEVEYRIQRPDSSVRWILDRAFVVPDKSGGPARWVGVAADVTERRRLEGELLQAQKMELVGKLAGGIAHDFNNLLTIISGYVCMLLDKDNVQPAMAEPLKRIFTASRQATGLVRQLLLFSRKRAPKPEVIDLNLELEVMTEMLRRLLGESIRVEFVPADQTIWASADLAMLEQVLMNLAVNARDAMEPGGQLTIALKSIRRRHGPAQSGTRVDDFSCITVHDTGAGIPAAILPRIFEPFFTTKADGRGTGLGLATAKDIVMRHDGWIEVESAVNVGTEFRIFLPSARAQKAAAPETAKSPGSAKETILLVEDEANVREFAAAVLQQEGYTVLQAKSAEAAMESWQWHSSKIDMLLSDVVLPGELSGLDLGVALQESKPSLRVLLTTGYNRESVIPNAGGKAPLVLSKPYTPRLLLQAVREALGR